MWNPESTDMESGIHSVESGIQDSLGLPYMGRNLSETSAVGQCADYHQIINNDPVRRKSTNNKMLSNPFKVLHKRKKNVYISAEYRME